MSSSLEEKIQNLPDLPGVYLFKDEGGEVIYVGKALSLRKRVRSYFGERARWLKEVFLVREIRDLDYIVTRNEVEALILEGNLIKRYKPRYNVLLKDDKHYPFIKVTVKDRFPALRIVRRPELDGSAYFGPFVSSYALKELLDVLKKTFGIRSCSDNIFKNRSRPCVLFQVKRCLGPCCGKVDEEIYRKAVDEMLEVLSGRGKTLIDILKKEMEEAARLLKFEKAAFLRNRIASIEKLMSFQVAYRPFGHDIDAIFFQKRENQYHLCLISVNQGKIIGKKEYEMEFHGDEGFFLNQFLERFYSYNPIPDEILVPTEPAGKEEIEEFLKRTKGKRVKIKVPKRGDKLSLIKLAEENLVESMKKGIFGEKGELLASLKRSLSLKRLPERIEVIDISHMGGRFRVGSVVVAEKGEIKKEEYRSYHLSQGFDDLEGLKELLERRYPKHPFPDLLLVDGGRGHLEVLSRFLEALGAGIDFGAIAKSRARGVPDRVYLGRQGRMIRLDPSRKENRFLLKLRDEAHRFSNRLREVWKKREDLTSELLNIKGIGEKRAKDIIKRFGSPQEFFKKVEKGEDVGLPKNVVKEVKRYLEKAGHSH